mmetsp:Transcript_24460/g.34533  ORF Transcript_24460/g.34533 Transcript_24460/m.34533 type:complete len:302 (-) Transcript_24460:37-942(-)|eukprot:CAMPEP_0175163198 /NCGR_PEP_ID=MMETSP0087-20121206/25606_1 /TAXON_ID=136419 /ORGANISM="Unknown Unknown, Strain D1" /LENGTH=301 /DNA_ID=CAMNT_0016451855 /DNA_START=29 /DNA_END=934 /DNA_ORIENTATION=-
MARCSVLLFSWVSLLGVAHAETDQCKPQFTEPVAATFDLSSLIQGANKAIMANDTYYNSLANPRPFRYFFNVCDKLNDPHDENICSEKMTADTSAFQIIDAAGEKKEECMTLGQTEMRNWDLIDAENDNAAVGVKLTYKGGTECASASEGAEKVYRSFAINFRCVSGPTTLSPISTVSETNKCEYDVTMTSIYGCPLECHSDDHNTLCNGHGVCAVDKSLKAARCFCNSGWSGDKCTDESEVEEGDESNSATSTLMTFAIIFLIALLGLAYVLYVRIKKLNADDNPYGAFDDQIPHTASLN